jgi:hypothetical protein
MIRDTHPTAVRVLSVSYVNTSVRVLSVSFVNPSVRMLRAVRLVRDTHSNCESVECELCKHKCENVEGSDIDKRYTS